MSTKIDNYVIHFRIGSRKQRKEKKNRLKKLRGTAKVKPNVKGK